MGTRVESTLRTSSSEALADGVGVAVGTVRGEDVFWTGGMNMIDGLKFGFGVGVGDGLTRADWAAAETAAASMRIEIRPSFIRAKKCYIGFD
jgi:hypothetical protein